MWSTTLISCGILLISTKQLDSQILGPEPTKILINNTVQLRCHVTLKKHYDQIKVQWLKDGFGYENETLRDYFNGRYRMPGPKDEGKYDLVISYVDKQDDGEYACQVNAAIHNRPDSNILKTTKSINLTVIVPPDIVILHSPNSPNLNNGSSKASPVTIWGKVNEFISVNCEVPKSRPSAQLGWQLGKFDLIDGAVTGMSGESMGSISTSSQHFDTEQFYHQTVSKLRIRLRKEHSGELLKCSVTNERDFLYHVPMPALLKINVLYVADVKIDVTPFRLYYQFSEHEVIQVNCSSYANPPDVIFNWIKYDPITSKTYMIQSSDHTGKLTLKLTRDYNSMLLRCLVVASLKENRCSPLVEPGVDVTTVNLLGNCSEKDAISGSTQIPLRVRYSPVILDSVLETKSAFLGDVVTLECRADSNPPAKISWYKSKLSLKDIIMNPDLHGSNSIVKAFIPPSYSTMKLVSVASKYQFTVTDAEKFGLFICIGRTDGFSPAQKTVFVGQGAPPQIFNNQRKTFATTGSSVRLPCQILSIPIPRKHDIQWYKDSKTIPFQPKSKDQIYSEERLAGLVSYLYIHEISSEDYGSYNCSVNNVYGQASTSFELIPPADSPFVFIIGSVCAIVLAIIFAVIIFCIIKTSKMQNASRRSQSTYMKGHYLGQNHSTTDQENIDSTIDLGKNDFIQMYSKNSFEPACTSASQSKIKTYAGLNFEPNDINHFSTYTNDELFTVKLLPGLDHQLNQCIHHRTGEWNDNQNSQAEGANDSMRSYDSGVCADESNLTASSPHHSHPLSNVSLPPCKMIPYPYLSKGDFNPIQMQGHICYSPLCSTSNVHSINPMSTVVSDQPLGQTEHPCSMLDASSQECRDRIAILNQSDVLEKISLPDITSLPFIIAYSPSSINRKPINWAVKDQSTKI